MNKKNLIIIVITFSIVLIGTGVFIFLNKPSSNKGNTNIDNMIYDEGTPSGSGGIEKTYDEMTWEYKLQDQIINKSYELYPNDTDFKFNKNNTISYTLSQLIELGFDLSDFNTETLHCDLDNSKFEVSYNEKFNYYSREVSLSCINDLES